MDSFNLVPIGCLRRRLFFSHIPPKTSGQALQRVWGGVQGCWGLFAGQGFSASLGVFFFLEHGWLHESSQFCLAAMRRVEKREMRLRLET